MKNCGLQIIIFIAVAFIGCGSININKQAESDYKILLKEQIEVHRNAGFNSAFQKVIED